MPPNPLDSLPHRDPFRFLTQVVSLEPGQRGQALWQVRGHEPFFQGHFPGDPIVPGVLISEALAQLSGIVALHAGPHTAGRLVHVDIRFDHAVRPPADIELQSVLTRSLGPLRQFDVQALVENKKVARGSLTLAAAEQQSGQ